MLGAVNTRNGTLGTLGFYFANTEVPRLEPMAGRGRPLRRTVPRPPKKNHLDPKVPRTPRR